MKPNEIVDYYERMENQSLLSTSVGIWVMTHEYDLCEMSVAIATIIRVIILSALSERIYTLERFALVQKNYFPFIHSNTTVRK